MRRAIPRIRPPPPSNATRTGPLNFTRSLASDAEPTRLPIQQRLRQRLWGTSKPPGQEDPYRRAPLPAETSPDMSNYRPASDARELPIVGLDKPLGKWEVDSFAPVAENEIVKDTEGVHRAVHRAVVETLTLQLNGLDAGESVGYMTTQEPETLTDSVDIEVAEGGEVRLKYGPGVEAGILETVKAPEESVPESAPQSDEAAGELTPDTAIPGSSKVSEMAEQPAPDTPRAHPPAASRPAWLDAGISGSGWVTIPLASLATTFALAKRIFQLTGQKVPDAASSQAKTVRDLITPLITPPKPQKLYERLLQTELPSLPNVKVYGEKLRPLDRERMIGRARLVEKAVDYKYEGIDTPPKAWKGHVTYR